MYELVLATALLVVFWSSLRRAGEVAEKTLSTGLKAVDTLNEVSADSIGTYKFKVSVLNAKARNEIKKDIEALDEVVSINDLEELIQGKAEPTNK